MYISYNKHETLYLKEINNLIVLNNCKNDVKVQGDKNAEFQR